MGLLRALLVVVTVLALVALPCLLLVMVSLDAPIDRFCRMLRRRARWLGRVAWRLILAVARLTRLDRLGRLCRLDRLAGRWRPAPDPPMAPDCPPIERVAADLRRLGRQRVGIALRSPVWHNAVERAYDERLVQACRQLDIEQHMAHLAGVDLEIERLRVQAALTAAGLVLEDRDLGHWQDQR